MFTEPLFIIICAFILLCVAGIFIDTIVSFIGIFILLFFITAGLGFGFGWFTPKEVISKVSPGGSTLKELGCGEKNTGISFGNAEKCETYHLRIEKCKKKETKKERKACRKEARNDLTGK